MNSFHLNTAANIQKVRRPTARGKPGLADGFHRHAGHKKAGRAEIAADIHQGTRRDAVLYSVGANSQHGLRRTNEDKRRAVMTLLNDPEWNKWSANDIAKKCGVSHTFVNGIKASLETVSSDRTFTTKHGTVATMNTANIGRPATPAKPVVREDFSPSERIAIAAAVAEKVGERRGRPSEENRQKIADFDGKPTKEIAAEKSGFGNPETLRQAKAVEETSLRPGTKSGT